MRSALVIIFSGPSDPKFIADAFVASEKVGEGGPWAGFGCLLIFEETERVRSERGLGMAFGMDKGEVQPDVCCGFR